MSSVIIDDNNFEDFEGKRFPKVLYKYRNWKNDTHSRFLLNREVYLSSPKDFDDTNDCKIPVRYDLMNDKQAKLYYNRLIDLAEPFLNRNKRRNRIKNFLKLKYYKSQNWNAAEQERYFDSYFNRLGIFCLTANNKSERMWNDYAENHTGFCIGYNSKILFKYLGGGGNVKYVDKLPIILPEPIMDFYQIWYNQVYVKLEKFKFEEEYRTEKFWEHKATTSDRQIVLPPEAFNCVILGKNMLENDKKEIINVIKKDIGNIPIINHRDL